MIVGVSFAMPGIIGQIEPGASSGFETAATILGGGTALGYMAVSYTHLSRTKIWELQSNRAVDIREGTTSRKEE